MSRERVNCICAELPGAEVSDPWGGGHDAWKVGGKMFACIGSEGLGVAVKTESAEQAQFLIELERAVRAPYFHRSWVLIDWDAVPEDELRDRLETSYRLIRRGLTKKAQAELAPFPGAI